MLNGIDILETYLEKYKVLEEQKEDSKKSLIRRIVRVLDCIQDRRYLVDLDEIQNIVTLYENTDLDSILNDIMLNINRYNVYLMNKKVKFTIPVLDTDIPNEDLVINLKDVLNYLEIKENGLDNNLLKDLENYIQLENFENFAKLIKTSNDIERVLFDKILDKNVLVAILLHSNIDCIKSIIDIFKKHNANLNRVVNNIPYIFIKDKVNKKCKYNVETYYDVFIKNVELLEKYNINFKNMLYHPVFFINDVNKNEEYIIKLIEFGIKPSNVLEHIGNILVLKPDVVFNNINVLKFHGIEFTDDNNNNGYTILGMNNLDEKIDYYIEKELWKNG